MKAAGCVSGSLLGETLFQKGFPRQASPNIAGNLNDIYMYCRQYLCTQSNAASSQSASRTY